MKNEDKFSFLVNSPQSLCFSHASEALKTFAQILVKFILLIPSKTWANLEKHFMNSVLSVHMSPLCFLIYILYNPQGWHFFFVQIAHLQYCHWQSNEKLQNCGWRKQCLILETYMSCYLSSLGNSDVIDKRQIELLAKTKQSPRHLAVAGVNCTLFISMFIKLLKGFVQQILSANCTFSSVP